MDIEPGGVSTAGEDLYQTANTANDHTKSLFTSSDTAAGDNPGWASAGALTGVKSAWQEQFGKLIQQTVAAADALKDSAGQIAGSDQEAKYRLTLAMHDLTGK
ncbi:hypothetical protein [Actinocrispum wychmicini]|uniref:Excreted virulence factor EspC (Type VII ESX diderm) n=1 Tax=Actinocrispum wychmicini TaxID=1213861 RepID=A0A4R2J4E2_9PSEU|nr:hypothetical protein [Actinocrispum wychmicini]TCO52627.1 hypothetical protein EV192_112359 [Actinocrispum wychmicini]